MLTVIGKEHFDSKHGRHHLENVSVRYGRGSDSEKGDHAENLEK